MSYALLGFIEERDEGSNQAQVRYSGYPGSEKGWIFSVFGYPALVFYKALNKFSCNTGGIYLCSGIQDAPDKENGTRLNVANQEDEGAV